MPTANFRHLRLLKSPLHACQTFARHSPDVRQTVAAHRPPQPPPPAALQFAAPPLLVFTDCARCCRFAAAFSDFLPATTPRQASHPFPFYSYPWCPLFFYLLAHSPSTITRRQLRSSGPLSFCLGRALPANWPVSGLPPFSAPSVLSLAFPVLSSSFPFLLFSCFAFPPCRSWSLLRRACGHPCPLFALSLLLSRNSQIAAGASSSHFSLFPRLAPFGS